MIRQKMFQIRVRIDGLRYKATFPAVSVRQAIAMVRLQGLVPYGVKQL